MKEYFINILIAIDQLCFTIMGGYPDETLSSALWRYKDKNIGWKICYYFVNLLFFWQDNHCKASYDSEQNRHHLPWEYR